MVLLIEILIIVIGNVTYYRNKRENDGIYRVEAKRIANELENKDVNYIDLSGYKTIIRVSEFNEEEICNNAYVVEKAGDKLYRIEYKRVSSNYLVLYMNIIAGSMLIFTLVIMLYINMRIIKPFNKMEELAVSLAKGNLSMPVKAEKSKYFGKFLWGMDMLRENLETARERELEYQKERKTLVLSLSHDIKTPLSAIELYTNALTKELYTSESKKREALYGIDKNAKEIKRYIDEIINASREDFLNLKVETGEFYLSQIMKSVKKFYIDKLGIKHTELKIEKYMDCICKGDSERVIEVIQNIMENAIKYGDGKQIEITFADEEDCRLIYISNTGCSINEEELPYLFDSFYRGSNSHNIKGSGLGLYICRQLMLKMDGEVFADINDNIFKVGVVVRKAK